MVDRPQADRILVAQLTGEARYRARWRELASDEASAAVAALRELAAGRADLLAEVAGIFEGTGEGELDEPAGAAQEDMGQSFASTRRKSFSLTRGSFHGGVSSARPYATTRETRFALFGIWRPACFTGPHL